MDSRKLADILDRLNRTRVMVVGDVMLDRYWSGNASRLSPEAPVPVVALREVSDIPGGAANVAANIAGLGAEAVLVGLVGDDEAAGSLRAALKHHNISDKFLVACPSRPTTTKTRVVVHNQQIARVDNELDIPPTKNEEDEVLKHVADAIEKVNAVALSDYAKGCLSPRLISAIIAEARKHGKLILVDPKSRDLSKYNGATLLTPNLAEAFDAAGIERTSSDRIDEAAVAILGATTVESLLVTLGEHGMKLFGRDGKSVHFPSRARQVYDVTGAGDTVVALLAAAIGSGADMHAAIEFANVGAGLAVEKAGTAIVSSDELRAAIEGRI